MALVPVTLPVSEILPIKLAAVTLPENVAVVPKVLPYCVPIKLPAVTLPVVDITAVVKYAATCVFP